MKKILKILAATSMIVVAPLNVISCKSEPEIIDEYDYASTINSFIEETSSLFKISIWESFLPYTWISEEEGIPGGFSIQDLLTHESDFQNKDSLYFKVVSEQVYKVLPTSEINSKLIENVTNNVNYKPVLLDSGTPLKDGIEIESIKLYQKGENLSVFFGFESQVYFKDRLGKKSSQKITANTTVNIFAKKSGAQKAQLISDDYDKLVNKTNANKYSLISDNGRQDEVAETIKKDEDFKTQLKADVETLKNNNSNIEEIYYSDMELKVSRNSIINASRYKTESLIGEFDERVETLNKALTGDENAREIFLRNATNDETGDWIKPIIDNPFEKKVLDEAIGKDPNISRSVNQYNLANNLEENLIIKSYLDSQKSDFAIDENLDNLTIGIYGVQVSDINFKIEGQFYELPKKIIFVRQKTSFPNTKKLYEDFIETSLTYQSKFYNLDRYQYEEDFINQSYWLRLPKVQEYFPLGVKLPVDDVRYSFIMNNNPKAVELLEEKGYNSEFVNNESLKTPKSFQCERKSFTTEIRIHFLESVGKFTNDASLRIYLFSYGNTMSGTTSFYTLTSDKREKAEFISHQWNFRWKLQSVKSTFKVDFYQ
ncbi:hypothetical protein [Spiroplasma alleghenense]|uniref:Uncharacterized protein n=1 Tax=Spiroplasma alleghenense TaxID=216931 RepID=A0A345Z4A4_9MOLU|nr:hypothetical protein [Spiroplasma alleghenense]AXK51433.1 hypothetical protein SALLE_v1c07630 [Spiroplasma alleghenense]